MSGPPRRRSGDWAEWHALIERYTPDGALGRVVLGASAGSASAFFGLLALFGLGVFTLSSVLGAVVAAGLTLATGVLAVTTLWPVYLSLIGNVKSASEYGHTGAPAPSEPFDEGDSADEDDPVAVLKRKYAAGDVSHEEFERRLDALVESDERVRRSGEATRSEVDPVVESER